jgi:hypothetical protein
VKPDDACEWRSRARQLARERAAEAMAGCRDPRTIDLGPREQDIEPGVREGARAVEIGRQLRELRPLQSST